MKNFKGVCTIAHYGQNGKGVRITLRDNTDEIVLESWEAAPQVRPGLYYVIENPGKIEAHTRRAATTSRTLTTFTSWATRAQG